MVLVLPPRPPPIRCSLQSLHSKDPGCNHISLWTLLLSQFKNSYIHLWSSSHGSEPDQGVSRQGAARENERVGVWDTEHVLRSAPAERRYPFKMEEEWWRWRSICCSNWQILMLKTWQLQFHLILYNYWQFVINKAVRYVHVSLCRDSAVLLQHLACTCVDL